MFCLLLFTIPRSPRWLVKKQRVDEAREILRLTGDENYEKDLQEIVQSIDAEHGHADEALFSRKYLLPIFLAISIGMFNQLSGINAILYYLNDIFAFAGYSKLSGDLQAVAVGCTNLIFTMIAMSVIDRIGAAWRARLRTVSDSALKVRLPCPPVIAKYTSARMRASSSAPWYSRCELSTEYRLQSASKLLRCPGCI